MRRWYSILAIGFLNAVLLLLLVNLVLYAVISVRKPPSPTQDYGSERIMQAYPGWRKEDVDLLLRETWGDDVGFEYDPFTGFRNKPFARKTKYVHIDSAGFRISKGQAAWPPSPENFTVFVFGGSTTFGLGLPDDETIASYLQECGAVDGKTIAVYNFGRTWYYSSQESILFQQLLKKGYIPQVAIFIDGLNEFNSWGPDEPGNASQVRTFMAGGPTPGPLDQLPMVKAAHWLGSRTLPHRHMKLDYTDRAVLESVVNRWLANKKITQAAAAVFGVRTVFVWQPVPTHKYDLRYHFLGHPDEWYAARWPRGRYGYEIMETLREQGKLGSDVLWLADMQQDRHENLYVDKWHYNAVFSKDIAQQICSYLSHGSAKAANSMTAQRR